MAKITSKNQVTVPKKIADSFNLRPGEEIEWVGGGDVIRVIPQGKRLEAAGFMAVSAAKTLSIDESGAQVLQ